MNKRAQKVKVYGVNSTKDVRARLIEILQERVMYHKDKFVAPILHAEMQAMEVKKNGKVEHSDNSHDDQVFSYLMALYVWYDGKNLAENFHIMKNSLRTDADEDLEEADFDDQLEARAHIDGRKLVIENTDKEQDILDTIEWVEHDAGSYKTMRMLEEEHLAENSRARIALIDSNPQLRDKIADETGVIPNIYAGQGASYINLPDKLFGIGDEDFDYFDEDGFHHEDHVKGNLADIYRNL